MGLIVAGQAIMLFVPVDLAMQRPTTHRSVVWPTLASGLMAGTLCVGLLLSVLEFVKRENAADLLGNGWPLLAMVVPLWAAWTVIFYRIGREAAPMDVITKQCRYLLRGSILELLVAVPTHIVARARGYCCAGFLTFVGIACGISVMLFSFGPSVFFLFAARWRRLHPQAVAATK